MNDKSLSDPSSLPAPEVIAAQNVEDAAAAIEAFAAVASELSAMNGDDEDGTDVGAFGTRADEQRDAINALTHDRAVAA